MQKIFNHKRKGLHAPSNRYFVSVAIYSMSCTTHRPASEYEGIESALRTSQQLST